LKKRYRFLFCLIAAVMGVMIIPQRLFAGTYGSSYWELHPRNSLAYTIPALLIAVAAAVFFYFKLRKNNRDAAQGNLNQANAASLIQERLLPEEKPIRQISNHLSDFVITDKRLLCFSLGGFQALEYTNISAVNYVTNASKKRRMVIALGIVMLTVFWFSGLVVSSAFSSNIRNVSKADALLAALMFVIVFWICVLWLSVDYGYYQIESKVNSWGDSWRIVRQRSREANANVDEFIKTLKEQINAANTENRAT
jgi:uncharacterized membrane protein